MRPDWLWRAFRLDPELPAEVLNGRVVGPAVLVAAGISGVFAVGTAAGVVLDGRGLPTALVTVVGGVASGLMAWIVAGLVYWLLARLLGGRGSLLATLATLAFALVPLVLAAVTFLPGIGAVLAFAGSVLASINTIWALAAVHRFGLARAVLVWALPPLAGILVTALLLLAGPTAP